jgi:hypothetical protein
MLWENVPGPLGGTKSSNSVLVGKGKLFCFMSFQEGKV